MLLPGGRVKLPKIKLGVLFGGRSCEHEVSVMSARSVLSALNSARYDITMIGISKQGQWLTAPNALELYHEAVPDDASGGAPVLLDYTASRRLISRDDVAAVVADLDVVLPLLHGPLGEDGTVQGLLELADVAYVGAGVVGSAVSMDKAMARRVFRAEALPQVEYSTIDRYRWEAGEVAVDGILAALGLPLFVKPANLGSSVGVSKVKQRVEFEPAVNMALRYDTRALVEVAVPGAREIECAVLGNHRPQASVLGEIKPSAEFYSYEAKYFSGDSELLIPAPLSSSQSEQIRALAVAAFEAVHARGMARVDFFVSDRGEIYLNEVNTIPGFTPISMYPQAVGR